MSLCKLSGLTVSSLSVMRDVYGGRRIGVIDVVIRYGLLSDADAHVARLEQRRYHPDGDGAW